MELQHDEASQPARGKTAVQLFRGAEDAWQAGAASFAALARAAVATRGRFAVALSGGETPRRMYELLAAAPLAGAIPWHGVHLFWGDERAVAPDHPRSNFRMAQEALLSRVPISPMNVHRIQGELAAAEAASRYADELAAFFAPAGGPIVFDLIHLGIGLDGHTASLFPGSAALAEHERAVVATVDRAHGDEPRVSLTLAVINRARRVEVLVLEAEKAAVVQRTLEGTESPHQLPARGVAPTGELVWLLSAAAAQALRGRSAT